MAVSTCPVVERIAPNSHQLRKLAMIKARIKDVLSILGIESRRLFEICSGFSIRGALREYPQFPALSELEAIVPDIADQYSSPIVENQFWVLKVRALHAFQCFMMLKAMETLPKKPAKLNVVDIGDSAGTHMLYLQEMAPKQVKLNTISVNLDPQAVAKIRAKGLAALRCRAEDLDLPGEQVDLFTTFEMVEHLHDPARFFHRFAKNTRCDRMLVTVPYVKSSRVGLHHIRNRSRAPVGAEGTHILELSPGDWTLLMLHAGWRVIYQKIYYQYPRRWPILSQMWKYYWRNLDYEGFWGAILEKDTYWADIYQDWEDDIVQGEVR
jgi:hypothetical protein